MMSKIMRMMNVSFDADYFETPQEYEDYINGLIGKKKKYQGRKQQRIICIGL